MVQLDVDEQKSGLRGTKYCIPVREPCKFSSYLSGLILEAAGNSAGQFRRTRLFTTSAEDLHSIILARNDNESTLPCECFDRVTKLHTICIV